MDLFVNVKKYQQAFLAPFLGTVVVVVFEPSLPMYPFFYLSLSFTLFFP
jgi:hypothetical protein